MFFITTKPTRTKAKLKPTRTKKRNTSPTPPAYLSLLALSILLTTSLLTLPNTDARVVVLIRHGEKDNGNNLSAAGITRSKCIADVFSSGGLKPAYIFAQTPDPKIDGWHEIRPLQTVQPLADRLNLTLPNPSLGIVNGTQLSKNVDLSADRDNAASLSRKIAAVSPPDATVMACWEHDSLAPIVTALGVPGIYGWSNDDFDKIWVIDTESKTLAVQAERCTVSAGSARFEAASMLMLWSIGGAGLLLSRWFL